MYMSKSTICIQQSIDMRKENNVTACLGMIFIIYTLTYHQIISTARSGVTTMKPVVALLSFIHVTSRPMHVVMTSLPMTMLFFILSKVFKKPKA